MQGFEMAKAMYGAPPLVADIKDGPLAHCGQLGAMNFRSDDKASIKGAIDQHTQIPPACTNN
jgi:hypothetical protein